MEKKIFTSILLFSTLLVLMGSSCTQQKKGYEIPHLRIVTTFYPLYIATRNVVNEVPNITVTNLTQPKAGCLHDYVLTTDDMKSLENAQILVINDLGLEKFLSKMEQNYPNLTILNASKDTPVIIDPGTGQVNPHVWVSIKGMIQQVQNIASELSRFDPIHKDKYCRNSQVYIRKLEDLHSRMIVNLKDLPNREMVTFHEAFSYFARDYRLSVIGTIQIEPGQEPSPRDLVRLIQKIHSMKAKVLFIEPGYTGKTAELVSRETGALIYILNPIVSGDGSLDSYLTIMEQNLQVLKKALS